jgi:hydrogenase maturation factor
MCLGEITTLVEAWDEGGARLGRLAGGSIVPLSFVPDAEPGSVVLVHLGIPVEVLDPEIAAEAVALRAPHTIDDHGGFP